MGWSRFFRRRYWDDERAREIQSYIDIETDENIARGMSPEEARCAAHKKFGNGTYVREEIYRMNTIAFLESLWQDLRYTFRSLRRNPGFAATAIVTLALGIGANTAVFSVVDAVIFRPLPYRDPGQLVSISWARRSSPQFPYIGLHSLEEIEDWRAQRQIFAGVEPFSAFHNVNDTRGKVGMFSTNSISTQIPSMLGVQPWVGRSFLPEDGLPGRDQVALISYGYWAREFGSDPAALGKMVTLDNRVYTVIGVMPRNFEFPPGSRPDAWVPWTKESNGHMFSILGRLRPGIDIDQAQREAVLVSDRIHCFDQEIRRNGIPSLSSIGRSLDPKARTALLVLLGAVGFVFLIACANVANLMLSRGATRQREIAIRAAIGASQGRLMRHFLTESLVLSVAGAVAALLLASFMTRLIFAVLPIGLQWLFMGYDSALDGRIIAFVGTITILACLLSGLTPAFRSVGGNRIPGLTETSRLAGTTRGIRRFHFVFQSLQVGLALVLLIGAGLMAGSFARLILTKSGFDTKNLWLLEISLPSDYKAPQASSFYDNLKTVVHRLPGVQSATISRGTPAARGYASDRYFSEGASDAEGVRGLEFFVAQDYFATLGIPIIAGRNFGPEDGPSSPPVAIIDSRCAAHFWPGQSAIGRRLHSSSSSSLVTVVGIAAPVKTGIFTEPNNCQLYKPFSRVRFGASLIVRMAGHPGPVLAQLRATVGALDPKAKITDAATFDELYAIHDRSIANAPRFYLILMLIFAGVALATAAVGIYGVLSYSVAQRISEIGVRMALGASARDIRMLLIRAVMAPVGTGIVLGIITSLWLTRLLRALLYEISPHDPITIISVIAFLLLVSLAACLLPCRRAARVDPMTALRIE
ncbi:MAG: ABC transporter permease [Acidobacteriia bacterium]|nr:ABC transporter permease [Terriglobia bacterium]